MKEGKVFKYGDNVNTDVIIPARYLNDASAENLRAHVLEDLDHTFAKRVREGDFVVGGFNFGSGSSREHAPLALKAAGVSAVIAKSFARIFFRNDEISENDVLTLENDKLTDLTTGAVYTLAPMDDYVKRIMEKGGLMEALKDEG